MKKEYLTYSLSVMGLALVLTLAPSRVFAQCETSASATPPLVDWISQDQANINLFILQEKNFIDQAITQTATYEISARLDEFNINVTKVLTWWWEQLPRPLKDMTKQLSVAQVDQTRVLGSLMDAQLLTEAAATLNRKELEAHRRYAPSELSCQADTVAHGQTKGYQMSRALNRGLMLDDMGRRANDKDSISAAGAGAEMFDLWQEYVTNFCDNTKGDQGCTAPGTMPGKHKDIPALLWGNKQTIDPTLPENRLMVEASLRYLISPFSTDPVPPTAVESVPGHQALLSRRSNMARTNAIYNVMGQMVAERFGGSGVSVQDLRVAGGIPPGDASTNASYREIQEAMMRDRFNNPEYIVRTVYNPGIMGREQGIINALRLQTLNDMYRRSEEMLFMESAAYASDLDKQMPASALSAAPLKQP